MNPRVFCINCECAMQRSERQRIDDLVESGACVRMKWNEGWYQ